MRVLSAVAALVTTLVLSAGCGGRKPDWVVEAKSISGWSLPDYFVRADKSAASYDKAADQVKTELGKMVFNLVNQYVAGCRGDTTSRAAILVQEALRANVANLEPGIAGLARIDGKYRTGGEYFVLGSISVEQLAGFLASSLGEAYDPVAIVAKLKEAKESPYRLRVPSSLEGPLTEVLSKEGFVFDRNRWYVEVTSTSETTDESSIASLTGPLWTVKARRSIVAKDRTGSEICRLDGGEGKGVSSSKSQATNRALAASAVDYSLLSGYADQMKTRIEDALKEEANAVTRRPAFLGMEQVSALVDRGEFAAADELLAQSQVTSKDFPQTIILYLRTHSAKEHADVARVAEGQEAVRLAAGAPLLTLRQNLRKLLRRIK